MVNRAREREEKGHELRLSATVTPKFFPLYHFFPLFPPLFFHLPQRFPLNTPPIPHYHYKISFSISTINFLSTKSISNNASNQCLKLKNRALHRKNYSNSVSFHKIWSKNYRAPSQVPQIYYTVVCCPIIQILGFTVGSRYFISVLNSIKYT